MLKSGQKCNFAYVDIENDTVFLVLPNNCANYCHVANYLDMLINIGA